MAQKCSHTNLAVAPLALTLKTKDTQREHPKVGTQDRITVWNVMTKIKYVSIQRMICAQAPNQTRKLKEIKSKCPLKQNLNHEKIAQHYVPKLTKYQNIDSLNDTTNFESAFVGKSQLKSPALNRLYSPVRTISNPNSPYSRLKEHVTSNNILVVRVIFPSPK